MVPSKQLYSLPSFSDVERKLIEFFRKKIACFSKQDSACPEQRFPVKKKKLIFFRFMFFGIWAETQLNLAKAFQHCCQNFDQRVQRYIFGKFSGTKLKGYFECSNFLSKNSGRVAKIAFHDLTGAFWDENFFSFSDSELKILGLLPGKVSPVLSKQHYAFWEQHFEPKWCFWRDFIVLLFMFSGRWENALGVWWNIFGMYVKF